MSVTTDAFNIISGYTGRSWMIDGRLSRPTQDDVSRLLAAMLRDMHNQGYDLIESGGILVKRDGDRVDVYVHAGEINATDNSFHSG